MAEKCRTRAAAAKADAHARNGSADGNSAARRNAGSRADRVLEGRRADAAASVSGSRRAAADRRDAAGGRSRADRGRMAGSGVLRAVSRREFSDHGGAAFYIGRAGARKRSGSRRNGREPDERAAGAVHGLLAGAGDCAGDFAQRRDDRRRAGGGRAAGDGGEVFVPDERGCDGRIGRV